MWSIAYIYTFAIVYKKLINIFLVLVLATQMLPVEQMGKILSTNQITEELPHSTDTEVVKKAVNINDFLGPSADQFSFKAAQIVLSNLNDVKVSLPLNHSKDIHNPPPNA